MGEEEVEEEGPGPQGVGRALRGETMLKGANMGEEVEVEEAEAMGMGRGRVGMG